MAQYLNVFTVSFYVHMIGAILLLIYTKFIKRKNIQLSGTPLYIYFVGFMGIALVTSSSFCAAHIGATATMSLSIIGQIVISTIIDHLGLGNTEKILFHAKRIPCYIIMIVGVIMVVYF